MSDILAPSQPLNPAELIKLAAVDGDIYCRTFFPKTYRVASPPFAKGMWQAFENPRYRFLNMIAFRGSAKTTRARTFTSKNIAYGESNTILYIGSSEEAALRSVRWIKRAVTHNLLWSKTFGLEQGDKWAENEIEIKHRLLDRPIWLLGVGIESTQIRGINFDDYRPDLIVCDDVLQDENSATESQREKISGLLLGAVKNSLISRVEKPNAKMVMLVTPQHKSDFSQVAKDDPEFHTIEVGCWTPETVDLPVSQQISIWPELYPTEDLRAEKLSAMKRNKLSIFTKEKEVRLTSKESKAFRPEWLKISMVKPTNSFNVLGVDPVPPPSDRQKAMGMEGKDYEALYVWGRHNGEYHLIEGVRNRGHEPNWTVNEFFRLAYTHRIARAVVEAVAYQRTLKWILEQEMKRRKVWYNIVPLVDKRKKSTRITSVFSGIASQGLVNIGPEDTIFAEQFADFSEVQDGVDDDLDASAIALSDLIVPVLERGVSGLDDDNLEELDFVARCP